MAANELDIREDIPEKERNDVENILDVKQDILFMTGTKQGKS